MTELETGLPTQVGTTSRLRRSRDERVIAGVCGGLGTYFGVDPVWFRVAFVVLTIGGGSGFLIYLVSWLVIPEQRPDEVLTRGPRTIGDQGPVIAGVALVAIGLMLLANALIPWFDRILWPLGVILIGFVLLYTGSRHERT